MQSNDAAEGQTSATTDELAERDVRALTQKMTTTQLAPDMYEVTTQSGSAYTVDMQLGACECWDDRRDDRPRCKHRRRVEFATGERSIPAWADVDAIDSHLGEHVDGTPQRAAADGGEILVAGDEGVVLDDDDDQEDDECEICAGLGEGIVCFEHSDGGIYEANR